MKTLLVPTDFSKNADNALRFAEILAKKLNGQIILLHVYGIPTFSVEAAPVPFPEMMNAYKREIRKQLSKRQQSVRKKDIKCQTIMRQGFTLEEIIETAEKEKAGLIVMGTKGASGLKRIIIGSNTAAVIEKSRTPVLAVPEKTRISNVKKIAYASDFNEWEEQVLRTILEFSEKLSAQLTILHVDTGAESMEAIHQGLLNLLDKIKYETDFSGVKIKTVKNTDVLKGINNYILRHQPDIMAMATYRRGLLQKIFGQSLTRQMAFYGKTPLLALHKESKTTS